MTSVTIAPLEERHWADVARIYADGIATGQATFETEVPTFAHWDAAHLGAHRYVALRGADVVGWAAVSPVSARRVYEGVVEDSVYVGAGARGAGVGRLLLQRLIDSTEEAGIWTLQAGVFPENAASVRLHERAGFRVVGTRRRLGRLHGEWRDVLLLERRSAVVA